ARDARERDGALEPREGALGEQLGGGRIAAGLGLARRAQVRLGLRERLRREAVRVVVRERGARALGALDARHARRRARASARRGGEGERDGRAPHGAPPSRAGVGAGRGGSGFAPALLVFAGCSLLSRSSASSCARSRPLWATASSSKARSRSARAPAS